MNLREFPDIVLKAWTYHEALLRLGYSADDIYINPSNDHFQVALKIGDRMLIMDVGDHELGMTGLLNAWSSFAQSVQNNQHHDQLIEIWESDLNLVLGRSIAFMASLLKAGFDEWREKGKDATVLH